MRGPDSGDSSPVAVGFTLVELLVSIAVIAILAVLVLEVVKTVREAAGQAEEIGHARKVLAGYANYMASNDGVMLAHMGTDEQNPDRFPPVELPDGGVLNYPENSRYPALLEPYFVGSDVQARPYLTWANRPYFDKLGATDGFLYHYTASLYPAFGINEAIWTEGQKTNADTYTGRSIEILQTRANMIPRPSRFIVLATGAQDGEVRGYFRVVPPRRAKVRPSDGRVLSDLSWPSEAYDAAKARQFGYISPRYGGRALVGFLDGHTELQTIDQLRDMRQWSRYAQDEDNAGYMSK